MKLKMACEIAKECGLNTIEEAVLNIRMHAINIFDYSKIKEEEAELIREAGLYPEATLISEILK